MSPTVCGAGAGKDGRPLLLFVYGTLMAGRRNHHALFAAGAAGPAPAVVRGYEMYAVSSGFPGIVPAAGGRVRGELYAIPAEQAALALAWLDRLEGVAYGLYRRERMRAHRLDGGVPRWAWTYVWNRPACGPPVPFEEQPWGSCRPADG